MNTTFMKGQQVTIVRCWDNDGMVSTRRAVVASAGKKRMTLVDAESGHMIGRDFSPRWIDGQEHPPVIPTVDDAEVLAAALAMGRAKIDEEIRSALRLANHYRASQWPRNAESFEERANALRTAEPKAARYYDLIAAV